MRTFNDDKNVGLIKNWLWIARRMMHLHTAHRIESEQKGKWINWQALQWSWSLDLLCICVVIFLFLWYVADTTCILALVEHTREKKNRGLFCDIRLKLFALFKCRFNAPFPLQDQSGERESATCISFCLLPISLSVVQEERKALTTTRTMNLW